MKLTARTVEAAKPGEDRGTLWDAELRGFGLRVYPTGRKVYLVKYRAGGGRAGRVRWFIIGTHGSPWTAESARREAQRLLAEVRTGGDPASQRAEDRAAPTVNALADAFERRHLTKKTKASTATAYKHLLATYVRPELGPRKVKDVTAADLARLHEAMEDTPRQANLALAVLSKMFAEGARWGLVPPGHNPARGLERYPENRRRRFLNEEEVQRLWAALAQAEAKGDEPVHALAAIRLLLLTGARKSEVLRLQWGWIDFAAPCVRLPDSKTGAKTIPLNGPAVALLRRLPRVEGNPHVIPAARTGTRQGAPMPGEGEPGGGHFVGLQRVWDRIRTKAGLADVRLHDLRHTFGSWGAMQGIGLTVLGEVLGHMHPATTARYAHVAATVAQQASEAVGKRLAAAAEGKTACPRSAPAAAPTIAPEGEGGGEVVELPRLRRTAVR